MSIYRLFLLGTCACALGLSSLADTVTLKSGEKIDGKIVGETVAKADVASVQKEQPDSVAWQPLKNLKPGANSLPVATYDSIITPLRNFTTQFPTSTHAAEAQKLLADFEAEKKRVVAGEIKLNEKWLAKEEAQKERYQINAMLAFNYMREQGAKADLVGALNAFDVIETQYPGARVYPDAVELARRVLPSLKQDVDRRLQVLMPELQQRRKQIDTMPSGQQRNELLSTQQKEEAAADAALVSAERQRLKWPPLMARSERILTTIQMRIPSEQQRLDGLDVSKMRQSIKLAEEAREAFKRKELDLTETTLRQSTDLWFVNELAARLQADLAQAQTAAAAAPEPGAEGATAIDPARKSRKNHSSCARLARSPWFSSWH
jgi:hypothetical protein